MLKNYVGRSTCSFIASKLFFLFLKVAVFQIPFTSFLLVLFVHYFFLKKRLLGTVLVRLAEWHLPLRTLTLTHSFHLYLKEQKGRRCP